MSLNKVSNDKKTPVVSVIMMITKRYSLLLNSS